MKNGIAEVPSLVAVWHTARDKLSLISMLVNMALICTRHTMQMLLPFSKIFGNFV
jgi:hypothetical protein